LYAFGACRFLLSVASLLENFIGFKPLVRLRRLSLSSFSRFFSLKFRRLQAFCTPSALLSLKASLLIFFGSKPSYRHRRVV